MYSFMQIITYFVRFNRGREKLSRFLQYGTVFARLNSIVSVGKES